MYCTITHYGKLEPESVEVCCKLKCALSSDLCSVQVQRARVTRHSSHIIHTCATKISVTACHTHSTQAQPTATRIVASHQSPQQRSTVLFTAYHAFMATVILYHVRVHISEVDDLDSPIHKLSMDLDLGLSSCSPVPRRTVRLGRPGLSARLSAPSLMTAD